MQRLEVRGAVRPIEGSLGFKCLKSTRKYSSDVYHLDDVARNKGQHFLYYVTTNSAELLIFFVKNKFIGVRLKLQLH
jgi:hypothetical protein